MMQSEYECSWWVLEGETEWIDNVRYPTYRNIKTGEIVRSDKLPIGALFALKRGPEDGPNDFPPVAPHDGLSICCVTAGDDADHRHHWYIDYRASNCTLPNDKEHRCWVRHGTFGQRIHVDKNGKTCGAGAGSFFMGPNNSWHGYLQNGKLMQRTETYKGE